MSNDSKKHPPSRDVTPVSYVIPEKQVSTDKVLNDALKIFSSQLERYKVKSTQGYILDKDEMKQVETCVSGVLRIKKDEREELAQEELQRQLSNMSEAELLEHMNKLTEGSK